MPPAIDTARGGQNPPPPSNNGTKPIMVVRVVAVSSIGLGLFSLKVFGYPFGFMAIIGTIGLVGVAINDSIVVLAAIKEDEKAN